MCGTQQLSLKEKSGGKSIYCKPGINDKTIRGNVKNFPDTLADNYF